MAPIEYASTPVEEAAFDVWHNHSSFHHLPINALVGEGVTVEDSIGHVKSVLDSLKLSGRVAGGDLDERHSHHHDWRRGSPQF